jgi:small-conductance mechanosensitive channel
VVVRFPVEIPHGRVEDLLRRATEGVDGVRPEPPPKVYAREIAAGAITYEVQALVNSPAKKPEAESTVRLRLQDLAASEGIRLL